MGSRLCISCRCELTDLNEARNSPSDGNPEGLTGICGECANTMQADEENTMSQCAAEGHNWESEGGDAENGSECIFCTRCGFSKTLWMAG